VKVMTWFLKCSAKFTLHHSYCSNVIFSTGTHLTCVVSKYGDLD